MGSVGPHRSKVEISQLRRLHGMLEHDGIPEKEDFSLMVDTVFRHHRLDYSVIENDHGYPIGTVDMWLKGVVPYGWPFVLPRVLRGIIDCINKAEGIAPQIVETVEATRPNVVSLNDRRRKPAPLAP